MQVPPGVVTLNHPGIWVQAIEIGYADATASPRVNFRPNTHLYGSGLSNVVTAWASGSSAALTVGDSSGATAFDTVDLTSATVQLFSGGGGAKAAGAYYSAADYVLFTFTAGTSYTAGQMYSLVHGFWFGSASSGAMIAAIR